MSTKNSLHPEVGARTVLVTGGAGFIGSHLTDRLLAAGHAVRVFDDFSTGRRSNLPDDHERLEVVRGDVRDAARVEQAMRGVDAVAHLAAVASVQASVDDPLGTHATNLIGTVNVLEAMRAHGVGRIVYASSAAVYGDTEELPVREDTILAPRTPYAADKLAGEHYLGFYAREHGLQAAAFRFFNIYGPRQDPSSPYSGVISIFADRVRDGRSVTVFGDGEQSRDFVFVLDLVTILAATLERPDGEWPWDGPWIANVGRGESVSLLVLLETLERLRGATVGRSFEAPRPGDIRHSRADVTRLREAFGGVPATPLEEGLARTLGTKRADPVP